MCFEGIVFPLTPPPFDPESAVKTLRRLMKLDVEWVAFTHFGVVEGSWPISKSLEKIEALMEIAKEVVGIGGVEEFVERLRKADEDVEMLLKMLSEKPVALSFIYTSATGMLDAAKKGLVR